MLKLYGLKDLHLSNTKQNQIKTVAAVFLGGAIPLLPLGVAVTQGMFGLGLVLLLVIMPFDSQAREKFHALLFDPITIAIAIMFMIFLATVPWSNGVWSSFTTILRTAAYIVGTAFIWAHLSLHNEMLQKTWKALLVLTAAMVAFACVALLLPDDKWQVFQNIGGKSISAKLYFKAFSSALLCLVPAIVFGGWRFGGHWRWLSICLLPTILLIFAATGSRSSVAGLMVMILAVALSWVLKQQKYFKSIFALLLVTFATGITWARLSSPWFIKTNDNYLPEWMIDPHRQIIWKTVFEKFLEAPFTGHGANRINFVAGADAARWDLKGWPAVIPSHPHNWILEILSETGVFGLTALIFVLTLIVWRLLGQYKNANDISALAIIGLLGAFFGSNLFNFSIWSTWWLLSLFFLFVLLSASGKKQINDNKNKKILFVATEDWAFCTHRIPTAKAARKAGYDVVVTAREGKHRKVIEENGFKFVPWNIKRKSLNPFNELKAIINLINIFSAERPSVAYNVTLKPIIYGSIAAHFIGTPHTINLFSGLGTLFISKRPTLVFIRKLLMPILRYVHAETGTWLMVQNSDDKKVMEDERISRPRRTILVPGSGIDVSAVKSLPEPDGPLTAILLSRMLWDKGVGEAVEAARILKDRGKKIKIVLVGEPDLENPSHIPVETLEEWDNEGLIEWWGKTDDIKSVWAKAHVALLPSYREGMPRSLLEAASFGRPLVSADSPGCRDLVKNGKNGILVPIKNAPAIADALISLDENPSLRREMGVRARKDMEDIYSTESVSGQISNLPFKMSSS